MANFIKTLVDIPDDKVFNQLSNITIISGNGGYRFTKALTKVQKQILSAFDAAEDILNSLKDECIR